ncbi:hypothetical protein O9929_13535 [Vibrio lentus]|nr:hypothetical protein [Vibrio lentus]
MSNDLALKYQQHYSQRKRLRTIMEGAHHRGTHHELTAHRKAMFSRIILDHKDSRLFASDGAVASQRMVLMLADLYPGALRLEVRVIPYHQHYLQNAKRNRRLPTVTWSAESSRSLIGKRSSYGTVN